MSDLVLDVSAAEFVFRRNAKGAGIVDLLDAVRASGGRLWIYTGEAAEILRLSSMSSSQISELTGYHSIGEFLQNFQWLSALAADMVDLDESDPMAEALIRAAARLGENTLILSTSDSRIQRGVPFVDLDTARESAFDRGIDFVDLKSQQDRIRPQLESNLHHVLHHGNYVMGPEVYQLEDRLARYVGVEHCVCVSSGTDALMSAMIALGVGDGDEIITSPFTFFATVEMIALLGAKPVYVDIDPETFNIDASKIEAAITSRTRAIMPISLYGQCSEMDVINEIAVRNGVVVIEDAAQSFGATYKGKYSGSLSDIGCTSFFPAKPLGAYGDAGACFTDDNELAAILRQVRNHGQDRRYHHLRLGINGRMDSLQAAVLLAKIEIFEDEMEKRRAVAERYSERLNALERAGFLVLPNILSHNKSSWAQFTLRVGVRDGVRRAMKEQGIPTAVHYPAPLYDQPALALTGINCPESDRAAQEVISLPMHPYLQNEVQERIVNVLTDTLPAVLADENRPFFN